MSGWTRRTRTRRARGWGCGGRGRAPSSARLWSSQDLGEGQRLLTVGDRDCALLILPHSHPALGRGPVLTLPLQLQQLVFVAHHPVFTEHSFFLQPEHLVQLPRRRSSPMIVGGCRCRPGIAPVVLGQIMFLQIGVGLLVVGDPAQPKFLHQSILMRAMRPLHPPLGLRRTGGDGCGRPTARTCVQTASPRVLRAAAPAH
jgi:hypothetical protein